MTTYKPITWNQGEYVTRDKLQAMVNNDDYLLENMPRVRYTWGINNDLKNKILAGRITVPSAKQEYFNVKLDLPNYFTPGCSPIVVATPVSNQEDEVHITVHGSWVDKPSATDIVLRGRLSSSSGKKKYIERTIYVDWIAVGY